MLQFNTNLETIINEQVTRNTVKQFTEINSKKKLLESKLLNEKQAKFITDLKNTFNFSIHNSNKYMAITMYYNSTKSYGFYVLELETLKVASTNSIKDAKKGILELLK